MESILAIKPGPKPKKEDGTPDKRRRVTPEQQPKHPGLKPHRHKPNDILRSLLVILLTAMFICFTSTLSSCNKDVPEHSDTAQSLTVIADKVYICDSPKAKSYHYTKNCRGLNNCKHDVVETTVNKAVNRGRTLCGWEK